MKHNVAIGFPNMITTFYNNHSSFHFQSHIVFQSVYIDILEAYVAFTFRLSLSVLSDVSLSDSQSRDCSILIHASFPLASHLAVSSNAVRVRYAVLGLPNQVFTDILLPLVRTLKMGCHLRLRSVPRSLREPVVLKKIRIVWVRLRVAHRHNRHPFHPHHAAHRLTGSETL